MLAWTIPFISDVIAWPTLTCQPKSKMVWSLWAIGTRWHGADEGRYHASLGPESSEEVASVQIVVVCHNQSKTPLGTTEDLAFRASIRN